MSPLKCHTAREAIWERAASAGPVPLSTALADHLASCPVCQAETRAVSDLLEVTRSLPDPPPPLDLWDGFDEEVERRIDGEARPLVDLWRRWGRRAASMAAMLVVGFALGVAAMRLTAPSAAERTAAERQALLTALAQDARREAYLALIEDRLAATRALEPLPGGLVAGSGVPSPDAGERMARSAAAEDRLRTLWLAAFSAELEMESHGFAYLDRRIASLAGQHFLYFVR